MVTSALAPNRHQAISNHYADPIVTPVTLESYRVRSWNNGMRCMSLNILIYKIQHTCRITVIKQTIGYRSGGRQFHWFFVISGFAFSQASRTGNRWRHYTFNKNYIIIDSNTCVIYVRVYLTIHKMQFINTFTHRSRVTHLCRWTMPSLFQIMTWPLFGVKQLSKPMLVYCQLDPWEQISVKFQSQSTHFHWRKCIWKCRLGNGGHFVSALMC